jgi:hypothetical protein
MVCYIVPAAAAIVHYGLRRNIRNWSKSIHHFWLSLLLAGGAIFGVVDHLWNGELFIIGKEPLIDVMLGVTITAAILVAWAIIVTLKKTNVRRPTKQTNI